MIHNQERLGHIGAKHRYIYKEGIRSNEKSWGNYYTYAIKASEILNSEMPKRQLRKHIKHIDKKIKHYEDKYKLPSSLPPTE